jgi:hypothetical protein
MIPSNKITRNCGKKSLFVCEKSNLLLNHNKNGIFLVFSFNSNVSLAMFVICFVGSKWAFWGAKEPDGFQQGALENK